VHGDAHVQNLMVIRSSVELIDFERVCWGQPEWDLAMTAMEFVTASFWTSDQYRDFVESYGFDITEWSGFPALRRTYEIKVTTWLMQNIDESRPSAQSTQVVWRPSGRACAWRPF
jgi:thiamine kinase-like enzyme